MKCPNCIDTELVNRRREWVTVDLCPECEGTWLERSEIERLLMDSQRVQVMTDDDWSRERHRVYDQRRHAYDDDERYERHRYAHRDGYRRKSWLQQFRDLID